MQKVIKKIQTILRALFTTTTPSYVLVPVRHVRFPRRRP